MPVAFILGVDWSECHQVGMLLGIKTVANEFIAYRRLGGCPKCYICRSTSRF